MNYLEYIYVDETSLYWQTCQLEIEKTLVIQSRKRNAVKFCMQITYLMLMDQCAQAKKEDAQNNFGKS